MSRNSNEPVEIESDRNRREFVAAVALSTVGVSGCLGGSAENEGSGDSGDDGDGSDGGRGDSDDEGGSEIEVNRPDFVTNADPVFGRMEPDWEEGYVTTGLRLDELENSDEAAELVMYSEGEDVLDGGHISDPVEIPIAAWNDHLDGKKLIGNVRIEMQNDFGDTLAEMEWELHSDLEVTEIGVAAENDVSLDDDEIYARVENHGDVAYIDEIELSVEPWDYHNQRDSFSTPADESSVEKVRSGYGVAETLGMSSDEAVLWVGSRTTDRSNVTCDSGSGELIVKMPEEDIEQPVEVGEGDQTSAGGTAVYCDGADLNTSE